jgi:hypothetical protein
MSLLTRLIAHALLETVPPKRDSIPVLRLPFHHWVLSDYAPNLTATTKVEEHVYICGFPRTVELVSEFDRNV